MSATPQPNHTTDYPGLDLLPHHATLLAASAISPEVAIARGYRSIGRAEARELGFKGAQARPGLLIPLWRVDGRPGGYQLRPDEPRLSKDGKPIKYETPRGQANILDVPPTVLHKLGLLGEGAFITEGARKADAIASLGLPAINIAGVYGWRGRNAGGGYTVLPDWEEINLKGATWILAFDADVRTNRQVHQALTRLWQWLEWKGAAAVAFLDLPDLGDGKTGVDDFLAAIKGAL